MSDFADDALKFEEMDRELAIAMHRKKSHSLLPVCGCHFCDSVLPPNMLFCDSDCRDDWEREHRARERAGRS